MSYRVLSHEAWAEQEFAGVDLGDRRLNRRVMKIASALAADPSGSIPRQMGSWSGSKGAYRLFDHEQATLSSLSQGHWQQTRLRCAEHPVVLLIQDTSWLDYSAHRQTQGLGWHGRSKQAPRGGSGLNLHSMLAVAPQGDGQGQVLGLAWCKLWARDGEPVGRKNQKQRSVRRRSPDRESLRWSEAVEQMGSAAPGSRWLHVGDRESDIFDVYERTQFLREIGFVIRLKHDRNAVAGHDAPATLSREERVGTKLKQVLRAMPKLGQKQVWIAGGGGRSGRWATVNVSGAAVTLYSPQLNRTGRALRCWGVRVWEEHPPADVQPLEWMILTSEQVNDPADALRVAEYYSLRWLIEEYHKCLKSGCKVEQRQLESAERLSALIGMLSIVATRLLQMKNDARLAPNQPAINCVPAELVQTMALLLKTDAAALTVRRFVHEVARLGGFLARKSDGEPGWLTLWHGWQKLMHIHTGHQLATSARRCG